MKRGVAFNELGESDIKSMEPGLENAQFARYVPEWCNTTNPYELTKCLAEYFLQSGGAIERREVIGIERDSGAPLLKALCLSDSVAVYADEVDIARRYLPALDDTGAEQWMGHRPTTPDSIPVIGKSGSLLNLHYAFGHGRYGLTMVATTAKIVAQSLNNETINLAIKPFSINRFASALQRAKIK